MDERLKRRVVGATVLVVAVVAFVPMLLDQGEEAPEQPRASVPSASSQPQPPPPPPDAAGVRVVPLNRPAPAPAGLPEPATATAARPAPAREKAPVKAPAARAAPVKSGFAIQLGSFSRSDNALGLRDTLKAKGYRAYVKTSGAITRVYVGPQKSRAEAAKALKKLLADTKMEGIVVNFSG